ncbi:MAG: MarR family transcriptional regulator [Solirubrobacterales bacterium]|nr:MarR family transcriptional regulator [Solirubrobacterales bacterium]
MSDTEAIETGVRTGAGGTGTADGAGGTGAAGQEVIENASPEAVRVALQLGTLFRRMLSFGAASTSLLDSGAYNLSFLEFKAMMNLGVFGEGDSFCVADISDSTGASMPAVSRAIDSLVRKGLVTRVEDPEDRRRRLLSLTDQGHEVTNAALMGRAIGAVKLADSFTDEEIRQLDSLLSRLIEREDLAAIHQQLEGAVHQ